MTNNPKILVGILYSGENEFAECLESLKRQSYTNWECKVFEFLPNKEAHDKLYSYFMENQKKFDLFLKLDADMILLREDAFDQIIKLFNNNENLDRLSTAVHDWFSDSLIMGMHVFSNRVKWEIRPENLFVDRNSIILGKKIDLWKDPAPLASHGANPTPFQSYHFGIHRGLKAFQFERQEIDRFQLKFQWDLLKKVWQHYRKNRDKRLGLVLMGVEDVIEKNVKQEQYDYTKKETLMALFEKNNALSENEIYDILQKNWGGIIRGNLRRSTVVFKKNVVHFYSKLKRALR